jgi:hypothetical protein
VNVESAGDDAVNDVLDLLFGCAFLHYDDHVSSSTLNIFEWNTAPASESGRYKIDQSL